LSLKYNRYKILYRYVFISSNLPNTVGTVEKYKTPKTVTRRQSPCCIKKTASRRQKPLVVSKKIKNGDKAVILSLH